MTLPRIQSNNIILRPITMDDTDLIVKWRNCDEIKSRFLYRKEFTREGHIEWMQKKVATGEVIQYIVELDAVPVGSVYFKDFDKENSSAEFGIFLGSNFARGKGLGAVITKLFTDFGHKHLGLHRIFLRLLSNNIAAYRTYRRAGYITDGIFRDMVKLDGKYEDIMFMSSICSDKDNLICKKEIKLEV